MEGRTALGVWAKLQVFARRNELKRPLEQLDELPAFIKAVMACESLIECSRKQPREASLSDLLERVRTCIDAVTAVGPE